MLYALNSDGLKTAASPNGRALCPNCKSLVIAKCGEFNLWHWAHENLKDCDSWHHESKTKWHSQWQELFGIENSEVFIKRGGQCHRADILTKNGIIIEIQNSKISPKDIRDREGFFDKMIWVLNSFEFKHNLLLKNHLPDSVRDIWGKWVWEYHGSKEMAFGLTIPEDDYSGQIINTVIKNNFIKTIDEEKSIEFWICKRTKLFQTIPKDIINAFEAYLFDKALINSIDDRFLYDTNFKWQYLRKTWTVAKKPIFLDLNNEYLFYIIRLYENGNGFGKVLSKRKFLSKYLADK